MRVPDVGSSQKAFRVLALVLTQAPLREVDWEVLDLQVERFSRDASDETLSTNNFWEATGGRAIIDMGQIEQALKL